MFGYTQKEALGTNSVELLHPNYTNVEIENKLREVGKKKILTNILYVKHKNGNDITVESKCFTNC